MSNVIAWDECKLRRERSKRLDGQAERLAAKPLDMETLTKGNRVIELGRRVERLIDKMAAIDQIETVLFIEQILMPYRRLNNET